MNQTNGTQIHIYSKTSVFGALYISNTVRITTELTLNVF